MLSTARLLCHSWANYCQ